MGVVYEADEMSLGRRVALKVLPMAGVLDHRQLTRFKNEARAAATLLHPHIVPVYSVGCERGVHYYAMQLKMAQRRRGRTGRRDPQRRRELADDPAVRQRGRRQPVPRLPDRHFQRWRRAGRPLRGSDEPEPLVVVGQQRRYVDNVQIVGTALESPTPAFSGASTDAPSTQSEAISLSGSSDVADEAEDGDLWTSRVDDLFAAGDGDWASPLAGLLAS